MERDRQADIDRLVLFNQVDVDEEYLWFGGNITGYQAEDLASLLPHFYRSSVPIPKSEGRFDLNEDGQISFEEIA